MKELSLREFFSLEEAFAEFTNYIPNTPEHKKVWSPKFADILLHSCSAIDSILRQNTDDKVTNYYERHSKDLSYRWVIFWGALPSLVDPFLKWRNTKSYRKLPFWDAYNKLKHDRYKNLKLATYSNALDSLGALLIIIIRTPDLLNTIIEAEIIQSNIKPIHDLVPEHKVSDDEITIETKHFSYLVFCNRKIRRKQRGPLFIGSERFSNYIAENYDFLKKYYKY